MATTDRSIRYTVRFMIIAASDVQKQTGIALVIFGDKRKQKTETEHYDNLIYF
jgi:hypothetical protein